MDLLVKKVQNFIDFIHWLLVVLFAPILTRTEPVREKASYDSYEDWHETQSELDKYLGNDRWISENKNSGYDHKGLLGLTVDLKRCREIGDELRLGSILRAHSRNVCRILTPALYRKSQIRTKALIHSYLAEVKRAIEYVASLESPPNAAHTISPEQKRQLMYDLRMTLGRTTLVLQGGAMMSMCHLGLIKVLHAQKLLPRIITGIGTGSFVAALVGTKQDEELVGVLDGSNIDLDAFERHRTQVLTKASEPVYVSEWLTTLLRRYKRYQTDRHIFDIGVLAECVHDNIGDITFEEAYHKTGRSLNITIAMSEVRGTPQLLNRITAPHVLVWSAAVASLATSKKLYAPVHLLCKSETGIVTTYNAPDYADIKHRRQTTVHPEPPLQRIGEIYNVNHFVVSQTRPYIAPFIRIQRVAYRRNRLLGFLVYKVFRELLHWLDTLYFLNLLPTFLMRILMDEEAPSSAAWPKILIAPEIHLRDFGALFEIPDQAKLGEWSARGERSVWPYICELNCRCDIEFAIEAALEELNRKVPPPKRPDWLEE